MHAEQSGLIQEFKSQACNNREHLLREEFHAPLAASCGIHTMPPVPPQEAHWRAFKRAHRESPLVIGTEGLRCRLPRQVGVFDGRGHQALSSSFPALPRSCLTCAAWSLLRDRLTPTPCDGQESLSFLRSQNPDGDLRGFGLLCDEHIFDRAENALLLRFGKFGQCIEDFL